MTLDWLPAELRPFVEPASDAQIVALVLFGEARSEPVQGIIGVGCVIRNRVRKPGWWGTDFKSVCLAPKQFSCLFPAGGAANYARVLAFAKKLQDGTQITNARERQCVWIAHGIVGDYVIDATKGSTHYHTLATIPRPTWTNGHPPTVQIASHVFYANVA